MEEELKAKGAPPTSFLIKRLLPLTVVSYTELMLDITIIPVYSPVYPVYNLHA